MISRRSAGRSVVINEEELLAMFCWITILGGALIMIRQHSRSEALFYYFRLENQVPESHLHINYRKKWVGHSPPTRPNKRQRFPKGLPSKEGYLLRQPNSTVKTTSSPA